MRKKDDPIKPGEPPIVSLEDQFKHGGLGITAVLRAQQPTPKCEEVDGGIMVGTQFIAARDRIEIANKLMGRG